LIIFVWIKAGKFKKERDKNEKALKINRDKSRKA
jgi:hypothetical protein